MWARDVDRVTVWRVRDGAVRAQVRLADTVKRLVRYTTVPEVAVDVEPGDPRPPAFRADPIRGLRVAGARVEWSASGEQHTWPVNAAPAQSHGTCDFPPGSGMRFEHRGVRSFQQLHQRGSERITSIYACGGTDPSGPRLILREADRLRERSDWTPLTTNGNALLFAEEWVSECSTCFLALLHTYDVPSGEWRTTVQTGSGTSPRYIGAFVPTPSGRIAYLAPDPPAGDWFKDPWGQVLRIAWGRYEGDVVDRGTGIDPDSLAIDGARLTWVHDGEPRQAHAP